MAVAVDTDILVYAEGYGDAARCSRARQLFARLPASALVLPAQVLGELYDVLTRRARRSPESARSAVLEWAGLHALGESTWAAFCTALDAATAHQLAVWDALILAVAAEQRCSMLLTEDLQHGFVWRGVTVVDPFADPPHPLLAALLR